MPPSRYARLTGCAALLWAAATGVGYGRESAPSDLEPLTLPLGVESEDGKGGHDVRFSPWLYTCMGLLALLIGFGKRRGELIELDGRAATRAILSEYTVPFLDQLIAIVTGALILAYTFYTFSAPQLPPNHTMMLTVPFVAYGLFRYLYLVHVRREGGAPDELALRDRPLQTAFVLWGLVAVAVIYASR